VSHALAFELQTLPTTTEMMLICDSTSSLNVCSPLRRSTCHLCLQEPCYNSCPRHHHHQTVSHGFLDSPLSRFLSLSVSLSFPLAPSLSLSLSLAVLSLHSERFFVRLNKSGVPKSPEKTERQCTLFVVSRNPRTSGFRVAGFLTLRLICPPNIWVGLVDNAPTCDVRKPEILKLGWSHTLTPGGRIGAL